MKNLVLFVVAGLFANLVQAEKLTVPFHESQRPMGDDIQIGQVGYGGTGCPQGSASITVSPDNKQLSVIFDSFLAEAGGSTGVRLARKSCNMSVGLRIPQGYSLAVAKIDYRGYNFLPAFAKSTFSAEYFFAGMVGPKAIREFGGRGVPVDGEYVFSNELQLEALVYSACGAEPNLRINTAMAVKTNSSMQQAMGTVDSMDIEAGLIFHFAWKRCQ